MKRPKTVTINFSLIRVKLNRLGFVMPEPHILGIYISLWTFLAVACWSLKLLAYPTLTRKDCNA